MGTIPVKHNPHPSLEMKRSGLARSFALLPSPALLLAIFCHACLPDRLAFCKKTSVPHEAKRHAKK